MSTITLRIDGMTCEGCAAVVEKALSSVQDVRVAEVSYAEQRATVEVDGRGNSEEILRAIADAGYRAVVEETTRREFAGDGTVRGHHDRDHGGGRHLLILGAGSAAFAAAIRAAELGARVTMVERGTLGGTCVNVGCVPSKTLIRAADIRHLRLHHPFDGIPRKNGRVDAARLVKQKRELVERLRRAKYRDVLSEYPAITYVEGEARFIDAKTVAVSQPDGTTQGLTADRILIATGSHPWSPSIPGLGMLPYWTNVEALEAEEIPGRLIVVGGSAVGAELAQMFARLGSSVTLLEALPTLVPNEDSDLGDALAECFRDEGIDVHTGVKVRAVSRGKKGPYRVVADVGDVERVFHGDELLMATGRRASVEALDLRTAGVETDDRDFVRVDDRLRTSRADIYAAGDCTPLPQFVYVAAKAGTVAAENAVGSGEARLDLSAMPAVTFTDPQVASVGLTELRAREREPAVVSRILPMEHVPRALANRDTRGLIKIVAREGDERILGIHVLSPAAGEVIQTAALALKLGVTVSELGEALFPYLTEVEGLKLAAQTFSRKVENLSCCAG